MRETPQKSWRDTMVITSVVVMLFVPKAGIVEKVGVTKP